MSDKLHMSRSKNAVGKHWTPRDRVKAVAAYLVLGNMARVEEQTGIPIGTLNFWKTQPWWYEQVERIRIAEDQELDNTFTKIVKKTQEVILDRLENGEHFVNKDGVPYRKPVSLRDATLASGVSLDKRQTLRNVPVSDQNKIGMQERLKNLEMQFTKLVSREEKVIEGEVNDVSEEREVNDREAQL